MESNPTDEKFVYTKRDAIALYAFAFIWCTGFVTILSVSFGLLPKHYILYAMIQGGIYFIAYKYCKHSIYNNIKVLNEYDPHEGCKAFQKRMNDDLGSTATNNWRIETNLYSGSSLTSSSNTYILNNIINKIP